MSAVIASDLHSLNFRFLLLVQQTGKARLDEAARTFGLTLATCDRIAKMTIDQLGEFSQVNTPLFQAKVDDRYLNFAATTNSPALRAFQVEANS